jgi:hypothetical protein
MKKFYTLVSLIFLVAINSIAQDSLSIKPKDGKALIIVIRPEKLIGKAYLFPFGVDGKPFCVLKVKNYGYTNILPGKHKINGSKFVNGSYELTLGGEQSLTDFDVDYSDEILNEKEFEAGKIYLYKVDVGLGNTWIYAELKEIQLEEALELLKKASLTEKYKDEI